MSQPDDALDRAFSRLCLAVIGLSKRDMRRQQCAREAASAREFFYGDDSYRSLYLDFLTVQFPGARLDGILARNKGVVCDG
jgi:hypothetical protein